MVTSFLSLLFNGIKFNERQTFMIPKLFLCVPMFAAFAGARAFTLSVFLKETIDNRISGSIEWVGGLLMLTFFCGITLPVSGTNYLPTTYTHVRRYRPQKGNEKPAIFFRFFRNISKSWRSLVADTVARTSVERLSLIHI